MNDLEKAEMLKNTIYDLYSKEGRSKSYISRLLEISRHTVSAKIKEWNLPEPETANHITKSTEKFINRNRQLIKSRLDNNVSISNIAKELEVDRKKIDTCCRHDPVLQQAKNDCLHRLQNNHEAYLQKKMGQSSYNYNFSDYPGEEWKSILGYDGYMVSNYGRVKSISQRYNTWHLLTPCANKNNDRIYISLEKGGKRKNLMLDRIVAHAFCHGFSNENNTVNHKDGNVKNNKASNLEWVSQSTNEKHAYDVLNRTKVNSKKYHFSKIVYKNKYEFKTVAAFARFINKSETQTRRYLDEPEKHDIKLIS